jgi:hypothetical protein
MGHWEVIANCEFEEAQGIESGDRIQEKSSKKRALYITDYQLITDDE